MGLLEALDRRAFEPLAALGHHGLLENALRRLGIACEVWPWPPALLRYGRYHANSAAAKISALAQLPSYAVRVRARARALAPLALVHSNGIKSHLLGAWIKGGAKLLWHVRDFPPAGEAGRLLGAAARRADGVVANSYAVAQAWKARYPRLGGRIEVAHNGVNLPQFAHGQGELFRQRHQLWPGAPLVGMIGVLAPWKGQEIFIQAARRVLDVRPDTRFLIVGDDVYDTAGHGGRRQELERMAAGLGLSDALRFTGFVDEEIADAYAALDLAVHASTRPEPFGRVVIEAMAAGKPIIAADDGGVPEIIRHGENGWLTPPGDVEALALAILKLLEDQDLRAKLAGRAKSDVKLNYSAESHALRIQAIYNKIIGGTPV